MITPTSTSLPAPPPLSRRSLFGALALGTLGTLGATTLVAPPAAATSEGDVLPLVDALSEGQPDRPAFEPNEQVLASYLMILAPLANSVVDDDPDRLGWMEDGWWRKPNEPYNARIMEHVATLSWFYTHERDWNPYVRDEKLLARLDAALGFYLGLQHENGSFPESSPDEEGLAATGFGTVALCAALADLKEADALPERRDQLETALRSACAWLVDTSQPHWDWHLINSVNQLVAGMAGVAHVAATLEDESVSADVADRCRIILERGQAPAGFFHEATSFDSGYNFSVMLPDLADIYLQTKDESVVELARRWTRWFQRVVVMEPGEARGFNIGSFSARGQAFAFETAVDDAVDKAALGRVFLDRIPELAPFHATAEEKRAARRAWGRSSDPVAPRKKQDSSPRLSMHVPEAPDGALRWRRDAQLLAQPYLWDRAWTEALEGSIDQHFLLVRRPSYYSGALYGEVIAPRQRSGPSNLWHPTAGTLIASLNDKPDDYWGTITQSGASSGMSSSHAKNYRGRDCHGREIAWDRLDGHRGEFTTRFTAADPTITSDVTYFDRGIRRAVDAGEPATEQIPLVIRGKDTLTFSDGSVVTPGESASTTARGFTLKRGGLSLLIMWDEDLPVTLTATDRMFFADQSRQHHVLTIEHAGKLTAEYVFWRPGLPRHLR